jgi:hypothetical protein
MQSRPLHNTTFFLMTTCTYHGYRDLGFKLSWKNRSSTVVLSILYTMGRRYLDHCTLGLFLFFLFALHPVLLSLQPEKLGVGVGRRVRGCQGTSVMSSPGRC